MGSRELIADCWEAVGGDAAAVDSPLVFESDAWLGGTLPVDELAVGAVGAALLAAAELAQERGAGRPAVGLSAEHVALSFRSEAHALLGGRAASAGFAPMSRLVRCQGGGWARTHANYPHHAAALGRALGFEVPQDAAQAAASLERAAASVEAVALEEAVVANGGCAAALRSDRKWLAHPVGRAASVGPLVTFDDPHAHGGPPLPATPPGDPASPAAGLRVLDLTRVIAGPVAGRTLAALGAEVLRIDPPHLPELPAQHLDTGPGKRSAVLDLADAPRREALLAGADAIFLGYRQGALARFGLHSDGLAERHPRLVQVSLSAWGSGPWAQRRGFDSLVQVASGIAVECAGPDGSPGALPAQALHHATGHLMAAAALRGLARRARGEPVAPAHLALARTAEMLLRAPRSASPSTSATGRAEPNRYRQSFGDLALVAPPGTLDGTALRWAHGPRPLGGDRPEWV